MRSLGTVHRARRVVGGAIAVLCAVGLGRESIARVNDGAGAATAYERDHAPLERVAALRFEPNHGQAEAGVRFFARGPRYGVYLTRDGATLALSRSSDAPRAALHGSEVEHALLTLRLAGARSVDPVGERELSGTSSYYMGGERETRIVGVPGFGRVRYENVLPGADLVFYGTRSGELEFDVVLHPGAAPEQVELVLDGCVGLDINERGEAVVELSDGGTLTKLPPFAYQQRDSGAVTTVDARYEKRGERSLGFQIGEYDRERALVIDPVIAYATYFGGTSLDTGVSVALDADGSVLVAGWTFSTNFPVTATAEQGFRAGAYDAFVSKLEPGGSALVYSTYLGGNANDYAFDVGVDSAGNAYVVGETASGDFPTSGALQPTLGGGRDAFVAKLSHAGTLLFSTFLGGSGVDVARTVAVDPTGAPYVAGETASSDFPTHTPLQGTLAGTTDAFLAKLGATGAALQYSTYFGGSQADVAFGVAADAQGAVMVGSTDSSDLPASSTAFQPAKAGGSEAFVARFGNAASLSYVSYLGGTGSEWARGVALDSSGTAFVVGFTSSPDFPIQSAIQAAHGGGYDAFTAAVSPEGTSLVYSTFLGGAGNDDAHGVGVDGQGRAFIVGETNSSAFPLMAATQAANAGGADAFLTELDPNGSTFVFSSYFGGSAHDFGYAVATDSAGAEVVVVGQTGSLNLPTERALQPLRRGLNDAFITRFFMQGQAVPATTPTTAFLLAGLLAGVAACVLRGPEIRTRSRGPGLQ